MVDTKGQPAEPNPMAINMKLPLKKMGGRTRGCDPATWRVGTVENKIVNQLIITNAVPLTYCQVVNNTISTVDEFEEGILNSKASVNYGERKAELYCIAVSGPLTQTHSKLQMVKKRKQPNE